MVKSAPAIAAFTVEALPDRPPQLRQDRALGYVQGAADALLARQLGLRRLLVAHDGFRALHYGIGIAKSFAAAARRVGLEVVGTGA